MRRGELDYHQKVQPTGALRRGSCAKTYKSYPREEELSTTTQGRSEPTSSESLGRCPTYFAAAGFLWVAPSRRSNLSATSQPVPAGSSGGPDSPGVRSRTCT